MSMRLWSFSVLVLIVSLLFPDTVHGQWKLKPSIGILQVAGNMGLVSAGFGWDYGRKNQWETTLLYGYIPKHEGKRGYATFTLKQTYIPWSNHLNDNVTFEPLTCGMYLNSILSRDFWVREPDKYPKGYYGFSTKIRFNIFIGESISFYPTSAEEYVIKGGSLFWEFGATDIYIISKATNRYLKFWDIFGLSFGLKLRFC
ncbi:MAG: hypothetical protein E7122_00530 [Bacteroidales bacterium]|nr:hypothetical protein [Bacteroidales bacterium]